MKREPEPALPGRVLHVVGRVTDDVRSFLGPATHALARAGREQAIVMIDELRYRQHVASLHVAAELLMTPSLRNPIRQWRAVMRACRQAMRSGPLEAVHLHGLLPGLVGARAASASNVTAPIFFSPHGSRALTTRRGLGTLALWAARPLLRPSRSAAIVGLPWETQVFEQWKSTDLVESPVSKVFFASPRTEARHPLIVAGGRSRGAGDAVLLAQIAVLLSGEDLRVSFNWIGAVEEALRVRLNAAGVGVFDVSSDDECASRLAPGWIYLAPGRSRDSPTLLIEAMAAGLPCVVFDCEEHRELIQHGVTGYLCETERDMIDAIAALIDDAALRTRMGQSARHEARCRFGESQFDTKLLAAYALPG